MHVGRALAAAARRHPELPAVVDGGCTISYRDWHRRVAGLAGWLRRHGVRPHDRVAMAMRNGEPLARIYLAAQLAGAVAVPAGFRLGARELGHLVSDSGATVLVFDDAAAAAAQALPDPPRLSLHHTELGSADPLDPPPNDDAGLSVILYTSGTTGLPKGVPRTHRAEHSASLAHVVQCGLSSGERALGAMPINHTMGIRVLLSTLLLNGLYVPAAGVSEGPVVEDLREHRVTSLYLVPSAFHILLERMIAERVELPDCRRLAYAGAAMTPALARRCVEAFEPRVFVNHYGSTEIYTFTTSPRQREKPGCAGRAGLHAEVRLVTADPERRVLPDEEVARGDSGEVVVSIASDEAFAGYLHRPDATEAAIRDGWYFTRDVGRIDEEGELWVEGRVDDMMISGGENVHPLEIEILLARHPAVAEVVVAGVPDERWGQLVTAFVVPREGAVATPEELLAFGAEQGLAAYKRPRRVVVVREIPKSPVGKVLRRELIAGHFEAASR